MLQESLWAATLGMGVAAILVPVLYFTLMRNSLSLSDFVEMSALILLVGVISGYLLGPMSFLWTVAVTLFIVPIYSRSTFWIMKPKGQALK
jgi:hypothetical protein